MKRTLIRILPALLISVALIVSALILAKGMRDLAGGLYNISYSVKDAVGSAETMYQEIQDFPSFMSVDVTGSLRVDISGTVGTW
ncbi:MAG: hypothetical protein KJI72_04050 [Patescibacteria group bacterium]|nr:hypothetical protein [Patescibacteria group bacterium]